MNWDGWLILGVVALPVAGFLLWISGQYQRARHQEIETVLRKGLPAVAEITACGLKLRGAMVQYRFRAKGCENPITVTQRLPRGCTLTVGDKVPVRYLPTHPHIAVIVSEQPPGAANS